MSLLDWASVLASMLNYHLDVYRQMFWPFTLLGSMRVHSDVCGSFWRLWAKRFDLSGCEILLSLLTFVGKMFWPFWLWNYIITADVCGQNVLTFLAVKCYRHCWLLWATRVTFWHDCTLVLCWRLWADHFDVLFIKIIVILRFIGQALDLSGYWTSLSRWPS